VSRAKRKNPTTDVSVFNFVRDVLLLQVTDILDPEDQQAYLSFVMRFQQYTGPLTAKGLEDTAFYRYNRLVSLNEVGGDPARFGVPVEAFHRHNQERLANWPHALLATTTHDTKRSEDVRARINVLSEVPQEWGALLRRWSLLNKKKKTLVDGQPAPDRNDEYLFYQNLLGAWPLPSPEGEAYYAFTQRMREYMRKATKEAKLHTSWVNPNEEYDGAVQQFVGTVLEDAVFTDAFEPFAHKIAQYGMYNALAQTLLKLTVPGVPDIYQGNELWDFSLVDPDNRRPVDYEYRRRVLAALQQQIQASGHETEPLARELLANREDGRVKLYVVYCLLSYRRQYPDLFRNGAYLPLAAGGERQPHVCAFARQDEQQTLVVIVPRLLTRLIPDPQVLPLGPEVWANTRVTLPRDGVAHHYRNLFTGKSVAVSDQGGVALSDVFAAFPVAVLISDKEKR
jgi:(1->4)-alpha-D-glucan 1-alpha-D-glucosylmutase